MFLEQTRKSALFPKKGAKLTIGNHESIFLEEVHFFVWFFPKKCTSSRKIYSNFGFWNSLMYSLGAGFEKSFEKYFATIPIACLGITAAHGS